MKKWTTEDSQVKVIFFIMVVVLISVVFPLFRISYYNFRSVDDYEYAMVSEPIWEESHSVIKVLAEQVGYARDYYYTYQGTFFSEWFFTSMIGIFSKNAYYMGTYFTLGGFVLAELLAFMVIFMKVLHTDIYRGGIITMGCLCLQILFTPCPSEAYFWFCGAMYYVFIHALALLLLTMHILMYQSDKLWKTIVLELLILFLNFAVGSGNFMTALTALLVYCLGVLWMFYRKHSGKWLFVCNTVMYLTVFMLSVLAPGNQLRQASVDVMHMSAIEAIFRSLYEAAIYVTRNMILPCMILGCLFLPLFISITKKSGYRYPFPFLVTVISFGLFASQFTPTLYSMRSVGPGRVQNLYLINYYVLLFGNELYWTGWFVRRWMERYDNVSEPQDKNMTSYLFSGWFLGGCFLLVTLYMWDGPSLTTVSALRSLRDGTAKQYYIENQERLKLLEDDAIKEVYLKPFTYKPYLLYFGDVREDPGDWVNETMAQYYGKEAIYLDK